MYIDFSSQAGNLNAKILTDVCATVGQDYLLLVNTIFTYVVKTKQEVNLVFGFLSLQNPLNLDFASKVLRWPQICQSFPYSPYLLLPYKIFWTFSVMNKKEFFRFFFF